MAIEDHFPTDKAKELNPIEIRVDRAYSFEYRLTFVGMDGVFVSRGYRFGESNGASTIMMEEKDRVMDVLRRNGYLFIDRTIL
ncbi:hypothetical protein HYV88_01400 [Candidatus Woesearchaeota archaeon]|nr:hypothetical protein [Candidatus Woesearchaeota archaeon]